MSKYITISQELAENIDFYLNHLLYTIKVSTFIFLNSCLLDLSKKLKIILQNFYRGSSIFLIDLELYVKKS